MADIPSDDRYRERWGALSFSDRRRILGSVTAGRALEDPDEAALAVVTAERQERFWGRIWWVAPVVALLFLGQGWQAYVINAGLATAALGALSWWRLRRVRRAGRRNRAVAAGRDPDASPSQPRRAGDGRGHTPGRGEHNQLPPDAKGVRPGAGEPGRSRRQRRGDGD